MTFGFGFLTPVDVDVEVTRLSVTLERAVEIELVRRVRRASLEGPGMVVEGRGMVVEGRGIVADRRGMAAEGCSIVAK